MIEGEVGYQITKLGAQLQKEPKATSVGKFIGRLLVGFGEQKAQVIRDPKTGRIKEIRRKGEA